MLICSKKMAKSKGKNCFTRMLSGLKELLFDYSIDGASFTNVVASVSCIT